LILQFAGEAIQIQHTTFSVPPGKKIIILGMCYSGGGLFDGLFIMNRYVSPIYSHNSTDGTAQSGTGNAGMTDYRESKRESLW